MLQGYHKFAFNVPEILGNHPPTPPTRAQKESCRHFYLILFYLILQNCIKFTLVHLICTHFLFHFYDIQIQNLQLIERFVQGLNSNILIIVYLLSFLYIQTGTNSVKCYVFEQHGAHTGRVEMALKCL